MHPVGENAPFTRVISILIRFMFQAFPLWAFRPGESWGQRGHKTLCMTWGPPVKRQADVIHRVSSRCKALSLYHLLLMRWGLKLEIKITTTGNNYILGSRMRRNRKSSSLRYRAMDVKWESKPSKSTVVCHRRKSGIWCRFRGSCSVVSTALWSQNQNTNGCTSPWAWFGFITVYTCVIENYWVCWYFKYLFEISGAQLPLPSLVIQGLFFFGFTHVLFGYRSLTLEMSIILPLLLLFLLPVQ